MNIYLSNNNLDKIFSLKLIKNRQKIISQKLYQERKNANLGDFLVPTQPNAHSTRD